MRPVAVLGLGLLMLFCFAAPAGAQGSGEIQAGREYVELPGSPVLHNPADGRIEVVSFFWYNCGACYHIDPLITDWAAKLPADVRFVRLPFSYREPTIFHARIFFTLRELGLDHKADEIVFDLFQQKHQPVSKPADLPRLAAALKIDPDRLAKVFNSPEVTARMDFLDKLMLAYDLPGVPSMVIDGRYRFDLGTTNGPAGFLEVADQLIEKERQARKAPK